MSLINDLTQFKIYRKLEGKAHPHPSEFPVDSEEDDIASTLDQYPVVYKNSHKSFLMQKAIEKGQAELGPRGELIVMTGKQTGRSADDKYVVRNEQTEKTIWWENNIKSMSDKTFSTLREDLLKYLNSHREIYFTERSVGLVKHHAINIDFISEMPSAAFFTQYMFKDKQEDAQETYQIIHAPFFKLDPHVYGTRSEIVIVTNFKERCTIIVGTSYAGEIKKSMFSIMNYVTPELGILPMHSGANQNLAGESFVFFGLSGTGKTTLSTDQGTLLIGDDEHGLSDEGLFNFEGGCYAKTFKLSPETEPDIYKASTRFSSFIENVKMDPQSREIDFFDDTITENGRSSYPLEFIDARVSTGEGPIPKHMFFLSADAFGVLPPVSRLNHQQAMDYFVLGYTAKLAGTEIGVKTPKATFSPCFGAPFMLRHPSEYSALLAGYLKRHNINVWLINTGWSGGAYGTGQRFPLKVTRDIIRSIQNHELDKADFVKDKVFGVEIPSRVRSIDPKILQPQKAWASEADYEKAAQTLAESFQTQLAKFRQ